MRVLGVDPGTLATGYGIVDTTGRGLEHIAHGVIRTRASDPLWRRLKLIRDALAEVIAAHRPEALSLERCFVSKNPQSALKLGHTRGVIMVVCLDSDLAVAEYTPGQIKSAVTGYGRADKQQVQEMVRLLLGLDAVAPTDASDALAAAICHMHALGSPAVLRVAR